MISIVLTIVPKDPIDNNPALAQMIITPCRRQAIICNNDETIHWRI